MKTAMQLLFEEFEALSKVSKDAKDERTANLIDFLCERKQVALEKEKEQQLNLIRFIRLNEKMGKSIEDLYNEYQNK